MTQNSLVGQYNKNTIDVLKYWINRLLTLCVVVEIIFFPQWEIILGCLAMVFGWTISSKYVVTYHNLRNYPLPVVAIFTYAFCYHVLPLVVTLIEFKPLTFNFQVPYLTFFNHILFVTTIVSAFVVCVRLYNHNNILNRLWNKIGYIDDFSDKEIWILGFIGLACTIFKISNQGNEMEVQATGNAFPIILNIFSKLAVAPVCLTFKELYSNKNTEQKSAVYVRYYIIFLMIIGIASTRRMLIFNSFATLGCLFLFYKLYNNKSIFTGKTTAIIALAFYLITGPIADLAASMIIYRQDTSESSAGETFNKVITLYNDKENLHNTYQLMLASRDNEGDNSLGWSEYYVDNIFLDRFCNLRVIDATLYNAQENGFSNAAGLRYYKDYWINQIPSSIANTFGLKKVVHGTVTDEMLINIFGDERYSIAGSKVGGATGIGLYCLGYLFYPIAFLTYIIAFYFMCSFVNVFKDRIQFPIVVLATFFTLWIYFNNANGIFFNMDIFTRANLNTILIFSIFMFFAKILFRR